MNECEGKIKDVESLAGIENALNGLLSRASLIENYVHDTACAMHFRNGRNDNACDAEKDSKPLGIIQRIAFKCEALDNLLSSINDDAQEIGRLVHGE